MRHNYWAQALHVLKPMCLVHALQQEKAPQQEVHAPQLEKSLGSKEDLSTTKKK